jgi:hypothetical protein
MPVNIVPAVGCSPIIANTDEKLQNIKNSEQGNDLSRV